LPLANTSYCQVCSGLAPYSHRPCRAHYKKPDTKMPGFFFVKTPDINQFDKPLMSS
jgi:hypothetical protein